MLTNLLLNLFAGFVALSLSSSVALHDSRFDKVFATVAETGDTAQHDFGHAVSHELHVHDVSDATHADPGMKARTHRKHTSLHHARFKLATLTA